MMQRWIHKPFESLSALELYGLMALRQRVFVVEQNCPYLDADGGDLHAVHLWHVGDSGAFDAVLRVFAPGDKYVEASLGRVATAPEARRTGLGRALVARGLALVSELYGDVPVRISAQCYLERFYGDFGFVREGENYLEDDIPHCAMVRASGGKPGG